MQYVPNVKYNISGYLYAAYDQYRRPGKRSKTEHDSDQVTDMQQH